MFPEDIYGGSVVDWVSAAIEGMVEAVKLGRREKAGREKWSPQYSTSG